MKGYLAGPMRGYHLFNFPAFDKEAAKLREQGHEVFSPAEHDRENGFDPETSRLEDFDMREAILWDLKAILESECVWVMLGFEDSMGCAVECALARFLNIPIYSLDPL